MADDLFARVAADEDRFVWWCETHDEYVTPERPHLHCSYSGTVSRWERVRSDENDASSGSEGK